MYLMWISLSDTVRVYWRGQGCEDPWLFFEAEGGPRAKTLGKQWYMVRYTPVCDVLSVGVKPNVTCIFVLCLSWLLTSAFETVNSTIFCKCEQKLFLRRLLFTLLQVWIRRRAAAYVSIGYKARLVCRNFDCRPSYSCFIRWYYATMNSKSWNGILLLYTMKMLTILLYRFV
jgi:hypothetical protein